MRSCDACGNPKIQVSMGGASLCAKCAEDVRVEIERLHDERKPVNALGIARRIYRETYSAGNYLLRDVPADLLDKAKHRAIDEGTSVRDLLLIALRAYLGKA